ncbi:type II secretion system protein [Planctomycetales bacterium ZRK34]|nr:type II secretion system protein [Planctomycetales bacterium ZRK34]
MNTTHDIMHITGRHDDAALPRGNFRGFTLLEIMFAIMILGVGLIAVAAIFPVSGAMQKSAFDDVVGQQLVDNIQALVDARGLANEADLSTANNGNVNFMPSELLDDTNDPSITIEWPVSMRCIPSQLDFNGNLKYNESNEDPDFLNRDYYWVPLVRKDLDSLEWEVYIFVLKKISDAVPTVEMGPIENAPLRLGEMVVSQADGQVGVVTKREPVQVNGQDVSGNWYYGSHAGSQSSTLRVVILGNEVIK